MKAFDSTNLRALMERSHIGAEKLAEATNINVYTIKNYLRNTMPTLEALATLADYFAVPLDFIAGRCDEALSREILKDYGKHFMELRRAPFESYLIGRAPESGAKFSKGSTEAVWPYNLFEAVSDSPDLVKIHHNIVSCVSENDIMLALDTLSPREKKTILLYYRDGMSYEEIGSLAEYGVRRERVRQIIIKALRKLRHPSRVDILRYGSELAKKESAIERKKVELAKTQRELTDCENELNLWKTKLDAMTCELTEHYSNAEAARVTNEILARSSIHGMTIIEMGLSTRAYNCLTRAGIRCLGDLIRYIKDGEMLNIHSLGRITAREILDKIKDLTGEDYDHLYPKIP